MSSAKRKVAKRKTERKQKGVIGWSPFEIRFSSLARRRDDTTSQWRRRTNAAFAPSVKTLLPIAIETVTLYCLTMKNNTKKSKGKKERAEPPFPLVTSKSSRNYRDAFAAVVKLLEGRKNVLVLAGAGQSVSCGIPDFRSRGSGLYSMLDTEVSSNVARGDTLVIGCVALVVATCLTLLLVVLAPTLFHLLLF